MSRGVEAGALEERLAMLGKSGGNTSQGTHHGLTPRVRRCTWDTGRKHEPAG